MTELTGPEREFSGYERSRADARAEEIRSQGGLAWVEDEYGDEMGHSNVFQGLVVRFFSPERVAAAAARGLPDPHEGMVFNMGLGVWEDPE